MFGRQAGGNTHVHVTCAQANTTESPNRRKLHGGWHLGALCTITAEKSKEEQRRTEDINREQSACSVS